MPERVQTTATVFSLLVILAAGAPVPTSGISAGGSSVQINQAIFFSSVPSYMTVGQNLTVLVILTNNLDHSLPIVVALGVPLRYMYVNPIDWELSIQPKSTIRVNFDLVPFKGATGPLNVTAAVWIQNGSATHTPLLAETLTTQVLSIRQPVSYAVGGLVVLAVIVILSYFSYEKKRDSSD